jgi:hypothetical protein
MTKWIVDTMPINLNHNVTVQMKWYAQGSAWDLLDIRLLALQRWMHDSEEEDDDSNSNMSGKSIDNDRAGDDDSDDEPRTSLLRQLLLLFERIDIWSLLRRCRTGDAVFADASDIIVRTVCFLSGERYV